MPKHLQKALSLAESVRFCNDLRTELTRESSFESSLIHYQFNERGLRLSSEMTPSIYGVVVNVCNRLQVAPTDVMSFVYASPDIQAACHYGDTSDCLIALSSTLIDLMDEDELAFVIGHEFGHFLLGHGADTTNSESSTEDLMLSRSREISADRVGMMACPSKEAALKALIKTSAGLGSQYLRFDISTFLDQIKTKSDQSLFDESTHPPLVMRCRSLLWFCMSEEYHRHTGHEGGDPIQKIDVRISKDMQQFVDGPAQKRISDANISLKIWLMAAAAIRDNAFTKVEQKLIEEELGNEILRKLLASFSESDQGEVRDFVARKLLDAASHYCSVAPRDYSTERPKIEARIAQQFDQPDFSEYASNLERQTTKLAHQ